MKQISIDSQINNLPLSLEAFRTYLYLACKTEKVLVVTEIGDHCFPNLDSEQRLNSALDSCFELRDWGLIEREEASSYLFRITDSSEWKRPGGAA